MARLFGINLDDKHRIEYALTKLHGISFVTANTILKNLKIDKNIKVEKLSSEDIKKIQDYISSNYKIEGELREEVHLALKRLKEIGSYRGLRHIHGLPAKGQRTRSNARTKRGKRKTVGALKKEDMLRMQGTANKSS